jgi:hypothetical protein
MAHHSARQVPEIVFRSSTAAIGTDGEAHARKRLGGLLARFAPYVERATVRFQSIDDPRAQLDSVCRIRVILMGMPPVAVEGRGNTELLALDRALRRVPAAVRKQLHASHAPEPLRERDVKLRAPRATHALERSATKPSRKSTRRSANHVKSDSNLRRRQMRRVRAPSSRAAHG